MNSPAFQFYPQDFFMGTSDMTAEEVGGYIRLLCCQWAKGSIPNNDKKLMQLTGVSDGDAMASIRQKFRICEDGALRNDKLENVRAEQQAYRQKQQDNAKKGWEKRKGNAKAMPPHKGGIAKPDATDMPGVCSSSSPSNKEINKENFLEVFNVFREDYPGSKRGNETEFDNFCKKHKDWREVLPLLHSTLQSLIKGRDALKAAGQFVPFWPNLQTYINQRRWETEVGKVETPPPPEDKQITAFATLEEQHDYWGGRKDDIKTGK